ncbi:hypothetical protein KSP40_PGU017686 [Platanthera guangdongensis]|uniref:Uncharacterized protein n=1 Tax=Platanthera guangdongensis TaxID=2320717 RepID=A0ABR2M0M2_9ASPA
MFSASLSGAFLHSPLSSNKKKKPILPSTRRPLLAIAAFKIEMDEIAELARNKVLVACTLSWAIGQLSKSFTSPIRGNGFDWKAAVRSGGMPSTHSASVAAAATSVGLERGFSDPIFGMSVIFAALVMYDAQGGRRVVWSSARALTGLIRTRKISLVRDGCQMDSTSSMPLLPPPLLFLLPTDIVVSGMFPSGLSRKLFRMSLYKSYLASRFASPLKESRGYRELKVRAGACFCFLSKLGAYDLYAPACGGDVRDHMVAVREQYKSEIAKLMPWLSHKSTHSPLKRKVKKAKADKALDESIPLNLAPQPLNLGSRFLTMLRLSGMSFSLLVAVPVFDHFAHSQGRLADEMVAFSTLMDVDAPLRD